MRRKSCAKMLLTLHYHCQEWNVENERSRVGQRRAKRTQLHFDYACWSVSVFINTFQWVESDQQQWHGGSLLDSTRLRPTIEYFVHTVAHVHSEYSNQNGQTKNHERKMRITSTTIHTSNKHPTDAHKKSDEQVRRQQNRTHHRYDIIKSYQQWNMAKKARLLIKWPESAGKCEKCETL